MLEECEKRNATNATNVLRFFLLLTTCPPNPNKRRQLGVCVLPGSLRSYRLDAGKFEATSSTSLAWRNPRIQMIFDVRGTGPPFRTGVVTCEAVKVTGSFPPALRTNVLKVDYETGNEHEGGDVEGDDSVWLRGDELKYNRVSARSGLSLSSLASQLHINRASKGGK